MSSHNLGVPNENISPEARHGTTCETTRHAQRRMQQRGLKRNDVDLVLQCGTDYHAGRVVLRDRDVEREIRNCKRRMQKLERLRGSVVVIEDGHLITCYRMHGGKGRRCLREQRGRQPATSARGQTHALR